MKIRQGFILRDVAGKTFVVATGELSKSFKGMITLNETGKFIWNLLEKGEDRDSIVSAIMSEYSVDDKAMIEEDVDTFIGKLAKDNILE